MSDITKYFILGIHSIAVGLNVLAVAMSYVIEAASLGWMWSAFLALHSAVVIIWVLSWKTRKKQVVLCKHCNNNSADESISKDPYGAELKYLICKDCWLDWWSDAANSVELDPTGDTDE